jgi:hypothetical protein
MCKYCSLTKMFVLWQMELCIMLLECCSQERTYLRYYGLLGQRFCMINKVYQENFEKCFVQQYSMIHRLETNKLRNVAKFFAHLLGTDALPWHVLAYIRLTEEDTTSSSRIFIKILFQVCLQRSCLQVVAIYHYRYFIRIPICVFFSCRNYRSTWAYAYSMRG